MIRRNKHFAKLSPHYFFREVDLRRRAFLKEHPEAQLISLGIGDTTEPLPSCIAEALKNAAYELGTREGYQGYGPEQGNSALRKKISEVIYQGKIAPDSIFISDGAKCDLGRLQLLFGEGLSIAVQNPTYPVYVDGSLLQGSREIISLSCTPENDFFPDLEAAASADLIYFCSPNNPTGAVATFEQLTKLVQFAKKNRSLIIFDAAYAPFISGNDFPRSIYEVPGAEEVAIEIHSFSKLIGFTGVRLGWTVVPEQLKYEDGSSIRADWNRLLSTLFNGASHIAQQGGLATLEPEGQKAAEKMIRFYLENAALLKESFLAKGMRVFGGEQAPYLWIECEGKKSWDLFHLFLEKYHLVVTPGVGFGKEGEGFVRVTAFTSRENAFIVKERLRNNSDFN